MPAADTAPKKMPYHAALVVAFAGGLSSTEAAATAHVSAVTARRWHAKPENRAEVERAREELIRASVGRLAASAAKAATTLETLLGEEHAAGVRCRAALGILDALLRAREHITLAERLAAIEATLAAKGETA